MYPHGSCAAHDIFGIRLYIVSLEVGQLLFEVAHFVLQVHDVIAGDLAAFCGIIIFAVGVCSLAGAAAWQARIASCLALWGGHSVLLGSGIHSSFRETYRSAATTGCEGVGNAVGGARGGLLFGRQHAVLSALRGLDVHYGHGGDLQEARRQRPAEAGREAADIERVRTSIPGP